MPKEKIRAFRAKAKGAKNSRMIWLGLAVTIFGFLEAQFRTIETFIPERYRGLGLVAIGLTVIVLRFVTTLPLEDMQDEPEPGDDPPAA
jgi:hypothetical protein